MKELSIRDFAHNLSANLKLVKEGERLVLLERNVPIADVIPHSETVIHPGWKRKIDRLPPLSVTSFSQSIIDSREEE